MYLSPYQKCYTIAPDIDNQAHQSSSKSKGDTPCADLGITHKTTNMNQYCAWYLRDLIAVRVIPIMILTFKYSERNIFISSRKL